MAKTLGNVTPDELRDIAVRYRMLADEIRNVRENALELRARLEAGMRFPSEEEWNFLRMQDETAGELQRAAERMQNLGGDLEQFVNNLLMATMEVVYAPPVMMGLDAQPVDLGQNAEESAGAEAEREEYPYVFDSIPDLDEAISVPEDDDFGLDETVVLADDDFALESTVLLPDDALDGNDPMMQTVYDAPEMIREQKTEVPQKEAGKKAAKKAAKKAEKQQKKGFFSKLMGK